jgi:hypothetical protein
MRLLWLYYKGSIPRYILCLELFRSGNKIGVLDSGKLDQKTRDIIIRASKKLVGMSQSEKTSWIKNHCPNALSSFKTLDADKANIVSVYKLN